MFKLVGREEGGVSKISPDLKLYVSFPSHARIESVKLHEETKFHRLSKLAHT